MNANKKVYWLVFLFCFAGYMWLGYSFVLADVHNDFTVCLFKNITGMPCPSCGITRSVMLLFQGKIFQAILINPLGLPATIFLIVIPIWILADFALNKSGLIKFFNVCEGILKKQFVYIPLILLCLLNWYWNIIKG